MRMTSRCLGVVVVCVAAAVATACDSVSELTGAGAPQFSSSRRPALVKVSSSATATGEAETTLGPAGGQLNVNNSLGAHELRVPPAAVTQQVVFAMAFRGTGYDVELRAWAARNPSTNVGELGFRRPVQLCLDVSRLTGLDASRLVIAQELPNGELDPVPSEIDRRSGHLCGALRHFSNYTVASD